MQWRGFGPVVVGLVLGGCQVVSDEDVCDREPERCDASLVGDLDGDGYQAAFLGGRDCDDDDASIHPGADELCDDVDNDCDDDVDENPTEGGATFYADADGDGFGDPDTTATRCEADEDWVEDATDCDDSDPTSTAEGTFYADADDDGYGDPDSATTACSAPSGHVEDRTDCDDGDPDIHPGATEVCDGEGADEDCNGFVNEDDTGVDPDGLVTYYADDDDDGYGDSSITTESCSAPEGYASLGGDCATDDPDIHPGATEVCDEADVDEDCDGFADDDDTGVDPSTQSTWYADADGDGYGDDDSALLRCEGDTGLSSVGGDCDDARASIHPGATEVCDTGDVDEDCDGHADDADTGVDTGTFSTFYVDADGDGYGDDASATRACDASTGQLTVGGDCDDADTGISPDATELDCNGIDEDCDGSDGDLEVGVDASTIGATLALASSGDTVCVPAGSYTESLTFVDGVTLVGTAGAASTTVTASSGRAVQATGTSGTLQGFTLTGGSSPQGAGLYVTGGGMVLQDLVVSGNDCGGSGGLGTGLFVDGASLVLDVESTGNTCSGGVAQGTGAWLNAASVDGLSVHGNSSSGTQATGAALYANNADLTHVSVVDNSTNVTDTLAGTVYLQNSDLVASIVASNVCTVTSTLAGCGVRLSTTGTLSNVAVVGNSASGDTVQGTGVYLDGVGSFELVNTIVAHQRVSATTTNVGDALYVTVSSTNVDVHHSDFWDNGSSAYEGLTPDTGDHNLFVDPQFVDVSGDTGLDWNLTLDTGSPLIDAGDTGLTDPDGSTSDIGAYGGPDGDW